MPAMARPKCFTVGELKEQLARLPDDLPISVTGCAGLAMYIYSVDTFDEEDCAPELVFEDTLEDDEGDELVDFWDSDDDDWMEVRDDGMDDEDDSDDDEPYFDEDDDEDEDW